MSAFAAELEAARQAQRRRQMDYGYRRQTPGYREFAEQARRELFPTPLDALAAMQFPLVSDAAGFTADVRRMVEDPAERTPLNIGLAGLGALPFVPSGLGILKRTGPDPERVQKAYKLFRAKEGKLYPLFVDANEEIPIGEWLRATAGEQTASGKVKSSLGPLAYRPGWHAGDLPLATHIGGYTPEQKALREPIAAARRELAEQRGIPPGKAGEKGRKQINKELPYPPGASDPSLRPDDQVWAEIDMAADRDWQAIANERMEYTKGGKPRVATAHITDQVPYEGFYRYKTNPNMTGEWLIGGDMRVNRLLTDEEVEALNRAAGYADLPRRVPLDLKKLGF